MTAPTFSAFLKATKTAKAGAIEFAPRHLRLVSATLAASRLGIADDPSDARKTIGEVLKRLAHCYLAAGLMNPDTAIRPDRWQHRPPDADRMAWLEATSRLVSHAELLAAQSATICAGNMTLEAAARPLLQRYENITDDLLTLCGALKLSPRECAETT